MEAIFHEQQDGSLCAQHCLNSLLQGQFYSAVDLADMANELDTMEKLRMAEMGEDTPEYRQFLQVSVFSDFVSSNIILVAATLHKHGRLRILLSPGHFQGSFCLGPGSSSTK